MKNVDDTQVSTIPINAIFDEKLKPNRSDPTTDYVRLLAEADVILGVDVMSQRQFLVYGRELLSRIVDSGKGAECEVVRVALDQDTLELELLIALVIQLKGTQDYDSVCKQ